MILRSHAEVVRADACAELALFCIIASELMVDAGHYYCSGWLARVAAGMHLMSMYVPCGGGTAAGAAHRVTEQ